jgi:hypothetical protein
VAAGNIALPTSSTAWLAVLVLGGIPAVLGWLAVPAWSLRVARWLRQDGQGGAGRYDEDGNRVAGRDDQPAA